MIKKIITLLYFSVGPFKLLMLIFGGVILGIGEMLSIGALLPLIGHFQGGESLPFLGNYSDSISGLIFFFAVLIFFKSLYGLIFATYQSKVMFNAITKISSSVLEGYLSGPMTRVYGDNNPTAVRNIFNESNLLGVGVFLPISIIFGILCCIFSFGNSLFGATDRNFSPGLVSTNLCSSCLDSDKEDNG